MENKIDYNSSEYKRSRCAYMAQSAIEYFISILVTDVFLAKLLSSIGISDALTGIISSFVTLAFVVQLMSIFLVRKIVNTKRLVMFFDTISIFFFMFMYFIPFITPNKTVRTVLIVVSILVAYIGKYLITSIFFKLANSYVEPHTRARFSANKEIISLVGGMVFTALVGYIIDRYDELGNIEGGFLFLGISIFILNICNFICLYLIKNDSEITSDNNTQPLNIVAKQTFGNKNFRGVVVLTVLLEVARYFTLGYMGVFKINDLMMSVFLIQIINIVANFVRIFISKPIARYSDKYSYAKGMELGMILMALSFLVNVFTTKSTWMLIVVHQLLFTCSYAGINQNSFNISYSYVDSKYITQAMAIKNSIGGICGFVASLLGGKILSVIQARNNMVFGIHLYAQQVLSLISFVIIVMAIIYAKKVIEKQKVMIQ